MRKYSDDQLRQMGLSAALPCHVGIIVDGNGRWAKARNLPRTAGHRAGMERLKGLITLSSDLGIQALTLYAFSTENWKRPAQEVDALFDLLVEYFTKEIDELDENRVCIRILGDISTLPETSIAAIQSAQTRTAKNDGLKLNIALNYGSRAEVVRALRITAEAAAAGALTPESIDETYLMNSLYTQGLPDMDLVIRTGGEQRLSNFLLMQAAYAELIFTAKYFPDYSDDCYIETLRAFQQRERRFGDVGK